MESNKTTMTGLRGEEKIRRAWMTVVGRGVCSIAVIVKSERMLLMMDTEVKDQRV